MESGDIGAIISSLGGLLVGIGAAGGLVFSYYKYNREKHRRRQAENEIVFNRAALGFPDFVHEWDNIGDELCRMLEETEIDRVLILRAWNGRLEPRWTTAVYQLRQGEQAPISYIHFELDDDYVHRIRSIIQKGSAYFIVDEMPECAIKEVYQAEGVASSYWSYINSVTTSDQQSTAIAYASFSSRSGELSQDTQTRCRIVTGRLKGLANQFDMGKGG